MLKLQLIGVVLFAVTLVIHGFGTAYWIRHLAHRYDFHSPMSIGTILRVLVATAVVFLSLHMVEVLIWAAAYLQALPAEEMWSFEKAMYFSLVTFTTLGYGDITLGPQWRLLSGIEAMNGIMLVGWSTAFLFAVLQRIWQSMQKPA